MKILITGATGFIGTALSIELRQQGFEVLHLKRAAAEMSHEVIISNGSLVDSSGDFLVGVDAVVNLAGAPIIAHRWTRKYKQEIWDSRVNGSDKLVRALKRLVNPPKVVVSASGINFYGFKRVVEDESTAMGSGFLADVTCDWEDAILQIQSKSCRVVIMRLGVVLGKKGGMLKQLLPIFKLGLGGPIGNGRRYFSWIALTDVVRLIIHSLKNSYEGYVIHGVATTAVTNKQFTHTLAGMINRPALIPVPPVMLRLLYGHELANETILSDLKVNPSQQVLDNGFEYLYPTLELALCGELLGS